MLKWSFILSFPVVTCEDLARPANSGIFYSGGTSDLRPPGTVATYTCVIGYRIVGTTSATMTTRSCLTNGGWSGSDPTCQRELSYANACNYSPSVSVTAVNCGDLTDPINGAVSTSSGTTFNQVATYSCIPGYMISGATTRTCQASGSWSLTPPTCQREYH